MIIMQILQPILVFWEQYNSEGSFISVCVSDLHLTYHNYTSTVIIILCIPMFPKISKFTLETFAKVGYKLFFVNLSIYMPRC